MLPRREEENLLAWPPSRYEVRWTMPADEGGEEVHSDGYHYPTWARQAANKLREAGLAQGVHVVRLEDGRMLYDPDHAIEVPIKEW